MRVRLGVAWAEAGIEASIKLGLKQRLKLKGGGRGGGSKIRNTRVSVTFKEENS